MSLFSTNQTSSSQSSVSDHVLNTYSADRIGDVRNSTGGSHVPTALMTASGLTLSMSVTSDSAVTEDNATEAWLYEDGSPERDFENIVCVVLPIIFGVIAVLGFVGNLSVIIVVIANRNMRSTTNILIIGLALADLVFIVVCVPFTTVNYVVAEWPFGSVFCKV